MSDAPRRGSSLFSGPGAVAGSNAEPTGSGGGAQRRSSSVLQPGALAGIGFGIDFDDSDYEDSDDEDGSPVASPTNGTGTGGPNHRPYVGGFAAAAYEAARMHHTQHAMKQQQQKQQQQKQQQQQKSVTAQQAPRRS
mmetsp:Transcript_3189/g.7674  ORF Transcript_3189/g.7674 Transcript_3189/m.7674 type:complete len:137 (+) Transcript_3189:171-581(+)